MEKQSDFNYNISYEVCTTPELAEFIAVRIHEDLQGSRDYIECKIMLDVHIEGWVTIVIWPFECSGDYPDYLKSNAEWAMALCHWVNMFGGTNDEREVGTET